MVVIYLKDRHLNKFLILLYESLIFFCDFQIRIQFYYSHFLCRFFLFSSFRIIPRLPPKKMVSDSYFLESRRRGLCRWLTLVCRHPVICHDALISFFLTDQGPDIQYRIREIFRRVPDEFMTSDYAASAKVFLTEKLQMIFTSNLLYFF